MENKYAILQGDCLETLKELPDNSVDSVVTDPPAGISFMGKAWDDDKGGRKQWIAWMSEVMSECLRVLKPGGHALVWAIPRTSHWTATALEDAGFEIRDVVTHLFGSGFPKSLNIEKAGAGSQWSGWGTALKPASEHWILVRKPCSEKTVAANVLKWGVGGLNIDGCRIGFQSESDRLQAMPQGSLSGPHDGIGGKAFKNGDRSKNKPEDMQSPLGRFPANLVLSCSPHCTEEAHDMFDCPIAMLDEQSGVPSASKQKIGAATRKNIGFKLSESSADRSDKIANYASDGTQGVSRFFYCAKASKSDKNAGLEGMPDRQKAYGSPSGDGLGRGISGTRIDIPTKNNHPTVKSTKLMQYLIRMVTPTGGLVLDPFTGSGSTGVAALKEGFRFIGIERESEYVEIAEKRLENAS